MNTYYPAHSIQLIYSGENFFEHLGELVDSAKEYIHIQTYILEEDATGKLICDKLKAASARGVKVFLLADAYGSKELSVDFKQALLLAGIRFRLFSPLFSPESIYLGRRLHHKIAVADKQNAIIGGINIADKYRGTGNEKAWLDYAVQVKGNVCEYLHDLCESIYERKNFKAKKYNGNDGSPAHLVRFRRNDRIRAKNEVHHSYREALTGAEHSVIIVASYFLPGYTFRKMLKRAKKRGVDIRIILAGRSDLPWLKRAEKFLYRFFWKHAIGIYEWPDSVLHGKAIMVDDRWITIGSYNVNHLSRYRSIELNADIKYEALAMEFKEHLERVISTSCIEVTEQRYRPSRLQSLRNSIAYYYYRLLMRLLLPKRKPIPVPGRRNS
ncbi:MAG TPA: phospholipase D-like domain-containing protein [Bacteroidia bacterium]|jgi:cardiolipin synthase